MKQEPESSFQTRSGLADAMEARQGDSRRAGQKGGWRARQKGGGRAGQKGGRRARQRTRLLVTALAAMVLLGIYLWMVVQEHRTENGEDGLVVYALEEPAIDRLAFTGEEGPVTLSRKGAVWVWQQDETFPLNQNFTETMVGKTAILRAKAVVAEGKDHYGTYGLDAPSNVITVGAGDREKVICLGSVNRASGDSYMAVEGSEKIYVVDASFRNIFSGSILSMAVRESLPDFTLEDITGFAVVENGRELVFTREGEGWKGAGTGDDPRPADRELVSRLLAQVVKLRYEELAVYQPDAGELEACGLGDGADRIVVVYRKDGKEQRYSLLIGETVGGETGSQSGSESGDCRYVYPEGGYGIYRTRSSSLEPFRNLTAEAFLSLSVAQVGREELAGIRIITESGQTELTLERQQGPDETDGRDGTVIFRRDGAVITEKEFNGIYYPLYSLTAEKRVTDIADSLTQPPVLTLEYRRLSGCGETVLVEFIAYDQNYYAAKVNGRAELLVNRQRVHGLMEVWK